MFQAHSTSVLETPGMEGQCCELSRIDSQGLVELVADLYSGPNSSYPGSLTNVDGVLYFTANDGVNGRELWRIKGIGNPELVGGSSDSRGIWPGSPGSDPVLLTNLGGTLYFRASDEITGAELRRVNSPEDCELGILKQEPRMRLSLMLMAGVSTRFLRLRQVICFTYMGCQVMGLPESIALITLAMRPISITPARLRSILLGARCIG